MINDRDLYTEIAPGDLGRVYARTEGIFRGGGSDSSPNLASANGPRARDFSIVYDAVERAEVAARASSPPGPQSGSWRVRRRGRSTLRLVASTLDRPLKRRLCHPVLPAKLRDICPALLILQHAHDMGVTETARLRQSSR